MCCKIINITNHKVIITITGTLYTDDNVHRKFYGRNRLLKHLSLFSSVNAIDIRSNGLTSAQSSSNRNRLAKHQHVDYIQKNTKTVKNQKTIEDTPETPGRQ